MMRVLSIAVLLTMATNGFASPCVPAKNPDLNNDGIVDTADYWLVANSFLLARNDPRFDYRADSFCDGIVDQLDVQFVLNAWGQTFAIRPKVRGWIRAPYSASVVSGESIEFTTHFSFSVENDRPFSLSITQKIEPEQGLEIRPVLNGVTVSSNSQRRAEQSLTQRIVAAKLGKYTITSTATVIESGAFFSRQTDISVAELDRARDDGAKPVQQWQPSQVAGIAKMHQPALQVSFQFDQSLMTSPPDAQMPIHVGLNGKDVEKMTHVEIVDEQTNQHWDIPRARANYYFGAVHFKGAEYGQCFKLHAVAHAENQVVRSFMRHTVCLEDKRGRPVHPAFEGITHTVD